MSQQVLFNRGIKLLSTEIKAFMLSLNEYNTAYRHVRHLLIRD